MLMVVILDLSQADIVRFDACEAKMITLLERHNGQLQRRIRALDGQTEAHILHFATEPDLHAYLADPYRVALRSDWLATGAVSRMFEGADLSII